MANRLPRQSWDEINVSHDRVKAPQTVEMKPSKEMKMMLRDLKKQNKKKRK